MGCRGKDFKELGSAAATGFSLSSSSATMPKERECLKAMGVSAKTRDTVVPLGGVFNMYGTSLYMGLTAFYATAMFNPSVSLMNYVKTAGTILAIALGAPGIPASNITLLDPVLQQTGLVAAQIHKIYAMVIPADRILDMTQTALNVWGDMIAAVHPDRKRLRYRRAKNIKKIREMRIEKEKMLKPVNDNKAVQKPEQKPEEKPAAAAAPKP
jgi:Na+/H+-dicarboxylate symporter